MTTCGPEKTPAPEAIERGERRSAALHAAIAARLREDPALLDRARAFVERECASADPGRAYWAREWQRWLDGSLPALLAFLVEDSEHARRMRKSGPFAGVLPARERWRIWRASASEPRCGATSSNT